MAQAFRFPFWPGWPFFNAPMMLGVLAIAGLVFSIIMLIDCLKRSPSEFINPITKNGEYDKLIWVLGIVLTFQYGFAGAIVYFFVVMRAKPEE
jgi:hypothetical protein